MRVILHTFNYYINTKKYSQTLNSEKKAMRIYGHGSSSHHIVLWFLPKFYITSGVSIPNNVKPSFITLDVKIVKAKRAFITLSS